MLSRVFRGAELALGPLDWIRARVLALLGSRVAGLHRDRSARIAVLACASMLLALALTLRLPLMLFTLGPVLLGIPHLAADFRYLVVKPKLLTPHLRAVVIGIPLALVLLVPRPEIGLLASLCGVLATRAAGARKAAICLAISGLLYLAHVHPYLVSLAVAHVHNVVAILFAFVLLRPARARKLHWLAPLAGYVLSSGALLSGLCDNLLLASGTAAWGWVEPNAAASWYVPSGTEPLLAMRIFAWFVFSQSVHYACWLRLIPDSVRERSATRSFRSSLHALVADFSRPVVFAFALGSGGLLAYAVVAGPERARLNYLNIAVFHGYLEFTLLALWLCDSKLRLRLRAVTADKPLASR